MGAGAEHSRQTVALEDEAATRRLAKLVAASLAPGDLVTLGGDLGAGKTTLARAVIRDLAGDPALEVPSPTFTLMQIYETRRGPLVHADLFRLGNPSELAEIGWDEIGEAPIVLVEWPERAGGELPADRLAIWLALDPDRGPGARTAVLQGFGAWNERARRALAIADFLQHARWGDAERVHMQGDASTRRYERLAGPEGRTAILMDAPRRPDGPPLRDGRPYSRTARLAEDVRPFVAMARGLKERGFSAPDILAEDLDRGLLLIEDLGAVPLYEVETAPEERLEAATDLLARLHGLDLPSELPLRDGGTHVVPPYDLAALLAEVELLLEWYLPQLGPPVSPEQRERFLSLWSQALAPVLTMPSTWTLRDYHSPNLLWLPAREDVARVGVLDFQDAVLGPPAYDLVSLLQDARVEVPETLELALLSRYVGARRAAPDFEPTAFALSYALLGAQRATKILGIFVRLSKRDGKHGYLQHLPRLMRYLRRDLAHPLLAPLRSWYETHLPTKNAPR